MKKTASIAFVLMCLLVVFATGCVTTIHSAAGDGNLAVVKQCIHEGADVDAKVSRGLSLGGGLNVGRTPLSFAAGNGHLETVEFLVANGANVNAKDERGWTPLSRATHSGHMDVAEFLKQHGAKE